MMVCTSSFFVCFLRKVRRGPVRGETDHHSLIPPERNCSTNSKKENKKLEGWPQSRHKGVVCWDYELVAGKEFPTIVTFLLDRPPGGKSQAVFPQQRSQNPAMPLESAGPLSPAFTSSLVILRGATVISIKLLKPTTHISKKTHTR